MTPPGTGAAQSAALATLVGTSCAPVVGAEASVRFGGFDAREINTVEQDPACGAGICLINHFQGLTTCPYGQTVDGGPPAPGVSACTIPGTGQPVRPNDPRGGQKVEPQCLDRRTADAVYCSCRCANAAGATDDGNPYCACPGGYACTQLVASIGTKDDKLSGAYCIKAGTAWNPDNACSATCDATLHNCP